MPARPTSPKRGAARRQRAGQLPSTRSTLSTAPQGLRKSGRVDELDPPTRPASSDNGDIRLGAHLRQSSACGLLRTFYGVRRDTADPSPRDIPRLAATTAGTTEFRFTVPAATTTESAATHSPEMPKMAVATDCASGLVSWFTNANPVRLYSPRSIRSWLGSVMVSGVYALRPGEVTCRNRFSPPCAKRTLPTPELCSGSRPPTWDTSPRALDADMRSTITASIPSSTASWTCCRRAA